MIGLDGVVITEHDWLWTEAELDVLREGHPNLVILAGIEVSAREGHFLAYGVTNPFAVRRGIHVADLCREVHAQGGAVVAAHPFRWGQPFDDILEREKPDLDGLELMTNNMDAECRRRAAEVQDKAAAGRPRFQRRPPRGHAGRLLHGVSGGHTDDDGSGAGDPRPADIGPRTEWGEGVDGRLLSSPSCPTRVWP